MDISLPRDLQAFVDELVESGAYSTPDEVVVHALWLLEVQRRAYEAQRDHLRAELQIAIDQVERGEVVEGDEVFARLRRKLTVDEPAAE